MNFRTREFSSLALLAINLICTTALLCWTGYVLHLLWRWFVVPIYTIPPITILQAAGVLAILKLIRETGLPVRVIWTQPEDLSTGSKASIVHMVDRAILVGFFLAVGFCIRWIGIHAIV